MFLEDTRPANNRALEVPREMRLSLLRWDYPEKDGQEEPRGGSASTPESVSARSAGRPSTSLAARAGGGRAPAGGGGDEQDGAEIAADGRAEDDQ